MMPDKPDELTEQELEKVVGDYPPPVPPAPRWIGPDMEPWTDPTPNPQR